MERRRVFIKWSRGADKFVGLPGLRGHDPVKVEGLGFAFDGDYFVASASHEIRDGAYVTRFDAERPAGDPPGGGKSGHDDPRHELALGVVKQLNRKTGAVELHFPWLQADRGSLWAQGSREGASSAPGSWTPSEEGDEVLVAFERGDARAPYVIGQLWHDDEPPADDEAKGKPRRKTAR